MSGWNTTGCVASLPLLAAAWAVSVRCCGSAATAAAAPPPPPPPRRFRRNGGAEEAAAQRLSSADGFAMGVIVV
jgi:hypothetical protein